MKEQAQPSLVKAQISSDQLFGFDRTSQAQLSEGLRYVQISWEADPRQKKFQVGQWNEKSDSEKTELKWPKAFLG